MEPLQGLARFFGCPGCATLFVPSQAGRCNKERHAIATFLFGWKGLRAVLSFLGCCFSMNLLRPFLIYLNGTAIQRSRVFLKQFSSHFARMCGKSIFTGLITAPTYVIWILEVLVVFLVRFAHPAPCVFPICVSMLLCKSSSPLFWNVKAPVLPTACWSFLSISFVFARLTPLKWISIAIAPREELSVSGRKKEGFHFFSCGQPFPFEAGIHHLCTRPHDMKGTLTQVPCSAQPAIFCLDMFSVSGDFYGSFSEECFVTLTKSVNCWAGALVIHWWYEWQRCLQSQRWCPAGSNWTRTSKIFKAETDESPWRTSRV